MIKAVDFIKTGFSADDATKLDAVIEPLVKNSGKIIVDFKGITIFTTLFFNNVFAKYILQIGPDAYNQKFELKNLSELGATTYQHSFENAVNYFNMSDDVKKIHDEVTENTDE